jgi:hypothetical protein
MAFAKSRVLDGDETVATSLMSGNPRLHLLIDRLAVAMLARDSVPSQTLRAKSWALNSFASPPPLSAY